MTVDIEKTINYGRQFGVSYSESEIERRLICKQTYSESELVKRIRVLNKNNPPSEPSSFQSGKIDKAKKFVKVIEKLFPGILLITITGSVAAGYCAKDDDIDLMIVTKNHQLWINRLLLRILVQAGKIPHRRYGQKEKSDEFCFNLWLEEGRMQLPKGKQTLRNAMDSILMIPILDKDRTYSRFLGDNTWIGEHMAQTYNKILKEKTTATVHVRELINPISWLNWIVFWPQYWYMKGRIKQEIVDLRSAFFHPSDRIRYANKNRR
jgi:predicted nucleotidyltransferase